MCPCPKRNQILTLLFGLTLTWSVLLTLSHDLSSKPFLYWFTLDCYTSTHCFQSWLPITHPSTLQSWYLIKNDHQRQNDRQSLDCNTSSFHTYTVLPFPLHFLFQHTFNVIVQHFPMNLWQTQWSRQSFNIFQNHFRTKYSVPLLYLCLAGVYESQLFWHCLRVCVHTGIYPINYFDNIYPFFAAILCWANLE